MEDKNKEKLKEEVLNYLGEDFDLFDFEGEYDSTLIYDENKRIIFEKIKHLKPKLPDKKKEAEILNNSGFKIIQNIEFDKYKKECENKFEEEINKLLEKADTTELEEQYFKPRSYIKMVLKNHLKGLILFGEGGLGKSYLTLKTLKENNLEVYRDFAYLKGYITKLELYHFLFENKNKLIVLDDINILDNEDNLNLLKGCLDDNNRWVSYSTTSDKLKCPNRFLFEGNIILLLNCKPSSNPSLRAVETRVFNYEVNFNYKTKIKLLFELAKKDYKTLSKIERVKIADFIKKNTSEGTINLNFRLLFQFYECWLYDKDNFELLARGVLKEDEDLSLIRELLEKYNQVKEAEREFILITGKSRASFFRLKKELK